MGGGERRLGRSESPKLARDAPLSPRASALSSPRRRLDRRDFTVATKSVSLRRKKRYTTEKAKGRNALACIAFSHPHRLIFHFG